LLWGGARAQQTQTSEHAIAGVEALSGIDPTQQSNWVTSEDEYNNNTAAKTIFLYNVGTGKFLNMGGAWGTHAALHTTPKYFFMYNNVPGKGETPTKLNIRTKQTTAKTTSTDPTGSDDYMQFVQKNNNNSYPGVYFDRKYNNLNGGSGNGNTDTGSSGWSFEKVSNTNSNDNFVYRIYQEVNNTRYYLVALTGNDVDKYGDDVEAKQTNTPDKQYGANAQWKLISKDQYYALFSTASANLSEPTDASFLLSDPDFSVNNRDLANWNTVKGGTYWFGTANYTKNTTSSNSYNYPTKNLPEGLSKGDYQLKYGRFFNALIHSANGEIWQGVTVTKPGWFLFRCRGISNVTDANGHVNAVLYAQQYTDANFSTPKAGAYTSQSLNTFPQTVASAKDKMLKAGKDFSDGKYENQVMLYVEPQKKENGEDLGAYYIRFGVKVGDSSSSSSAKGLTRATTENLTIFDTFRMLYAGKSEEPELILDEDNTDLYYLTDNGYKADGYNTPIDTYTNTTLHLMRKFKLNMWNTIILPVNLTYGQMKGAFGDDVKLAYLNALTDNTMRFLTVEPSSDDDVMLKANKPYIIYPTKGPGASQAYTATLHHVEKVGNTPADPWHGTYQGKHVTNGEITIAADHYQISKVTLDKNNINSTAVGTAWVPQSSDDRFTASNSKGTMTAQGTLAKTYSTDASNKTAAIISGRETCEGSYIMKNGAFYLVPEKKEYGLKTFRTWFTYKPTGSGTSKPTNFSFFINDEEVPATAIQDLFVDEPATRVVAIPGVFSLTGERLRMGNDLTGLPSGIYIMNGQKYIIK
jgi:hypothetical protein